MPGSSNAIASALDWIEHLLLGSLAMVMAVIAIASIGFLMLQGRIDLYRAARVVIGCFIVFGASTMARGVMASLSDMTPVSAPAPEQAPPPPLAVQKLPQPDPHAGAALIR